MERDSWSPSGGKRLIWHKSVFWKGVRAVYYTVLCEYVGLCKVAATGMQYYTSFERDPALIVQKTLRSERDLYYWLNRVLVRKELYRSHCSCLCKRKETHESYYRGLFVARDPRQRIVQRSLQKKAYVLYHMCRRIQYSLASKRTINANNATHYVKLGKKRRESSKRNYYIISPRVIIKAIVIIKTKLPEWRLILLLLVKK